MDAPLHFDRNLIMLRAFQNDGAPTLRRPGRREQPARGNHNGGVIRFGPDRKLYIFMGDNGRRGQLQNLATAQADPTRDDDQFGGPEPDDAHLTGVILRLNDDGSTPDGQSRSSRPAPRSAARWAPTFRRSMPTACATASAWRSIRVRAISGSRKTATIRSAS